MKLFINFLAIFPLIFINVSCEASFTGVDGEGKVMSKEIQLNQPFHQLDVNEVWEIRLIPSDETKMIVHAQKNILPLLKYSIKNGELKISSEKNIGSVKKLFIELYYKKLDKIAASSGSEVSSHDTFEQKSLHLSASSGGEIELYLKMGKTYSDASSGGEISLQGTALYFSAEASSGAEIDAEELKVKKAELTASSGADISIKVVKSLHAKTSSGGSIEYSGNPEKKMLDQGTSGGSITKEIKD